MKKAGSPLDLSLDFGAVRVALQCSLGLDPDLWFKWEGQNLKINSKMCRKPRLE